MFCFYRSPSKTNDKFESFLDNFELTLDKIHEENPFMISALGDFNAKSNNWCKNNTTSHEGSMTDAVTSNYRLHKLIQEPTRILNSSFSCVDLVHLSLHPNCHHRVVFEKFNLSILYPPRYETTVWFYQKADPELIRRAINEFHWIRALSNVSVDENVCYFTKTLLNIIRNFIPHEGIVCDSRDPPWINNEIKKLINEKNSACKSCCRFNRDFFLFEKFKVLQNQLDVSCPII